jgi:hypothetical protein
VRWFLGLVMACTTPSRVPQGGVELPAVVDPALPAPRVFAPSSTAATHYNAEPEVAAETPLATTLLEVMRPFSNGARSLVLDARLSRAAADLAEVDEASDLVIELAVQRHGLVEPFPELIILDGDPATQLRERLEPELFYAPLVRVGIATTPTKVAILLVRSRLTTTPIPRAVDAGGSITLDATLDERLVMPLLRVTRADGSVDHPHVERASPHRYQARVECGPAIGRMTIDLTARYPSGPATVASFPVWCGVAPASEVRFETAALDARGGDPAALFAALINRDRALAGLPALRRDREADVAATEHAAAGSTSAPSIAGVAFTSIAVASVRAAYEQIVNQPSSRALMLAREATHLGTGFAAGQLTIIYRRLPARIDVAAARASVERDVAAATRAEAHPMLTRAADAMLDALIAGASKKDAWFAAQPWLLRSIFHTHFYTLQIIPGLEAVRPDAIAETRRVHGFGVAVGQADHPMFGRNAIWVLVVGGRR